MIRDSEFNLSAYAEQVSKMSDEELSREGLGDAEIGLLKENIRHRPVGF